MEPVISPMYLYLIDLLSTIRDVSFIGLLLFGVICLLAMLTFFEELLSSSSKNISSENDETELTEKDKILILKILFFIFAVFLVLYIAIPTKDTMYKMLISSYITPDNINNIHEMVIKDINSIVKTITER